MNIGKVCKKQLRRVKRKCKKISEDMSGSRLQKITLKDGCVVWMCGVGWLASRAKKYEPAFQREHTAEIRSNIYEETMYALKTQTRDYYLEKMLRSGEYTFQNMFVVRNPYGEAPLTALALFETENPCRVRVTVRGDIPETDYVANIPAEKYHRVPILGLYAGRENKVRIELIDEGGNVAASHTMPIVTKPLPADLRDIVEPKKVSDNPAFENIMISGGLGIKTCVFDREGKIRYFLRRLVRGYGIFPLSNGHFFYMEKEISTPSYSNPQCVQSYDMDYLGRVFRCYLTKDGVHHTVEEKEGGNILAGSNTMLEHTEDMVIEIDRKTGEIVWSVTMEELFDKHYQNMMDWAHVNSAVYYEKDKSILLSLRNIHTVCLVDYETKKLRWMLSDPKFWAKTTMTDKILKPIGDVPWVYQQHAAFELDEDFDGNPDTKHIMVFDNHWARRRKAKSFDNDTLSYVSIYTVNEKEFTVSLYKRFGMPKTRIRANGIYCPEKGRIYGMAASYAEPIEKNAGGIYEFDFETGEVLSEFGVKPGFFRAYNFEPDYEELVKPVGRIENYVGGELRRPEKVEKSMQFPKRQKVTDVAIAYARQEDILHVRGVDHQILAVYFVGSEGTYVVRFEDTYQTMEIFETNEYFLALQFDNLPSDHYSIYLDVNGELQNTGKWIEK
jgi:hypothetical protein